MGPFYVFVSSDTTVPLNGSDPQGSRMKYFDQEEEARKYAQAIRRKCHYVSVHRTSDGIEIARYQGDYKCVGKNRTKVEDGQ
jgi:hypothetical protein